MNSRLLGMAVAMSLAAPAAAMAEVGIRNAPEPLLSAAGGSWGRKGKGKGKRPYHTSSRFVAMDKREARRRRNRR